MLPPDGSFVTYCVPFSRDGCGRNQTSTYKQQRNASARGTNRSNAVGASKPVTNQCASPMSLGLKRAQNIIFRLQIVHITSRLVLKTVSTSFDVLRTKIEAVYSNTWRSSPQYTIPFLPRGSPDAPLLSRAYVLAHVQIYDYPASAIVLEVSNCVEYQRKQWASVCFLASLQR